mmetsp:Transcript_7330/g.26663  ORF Transcript_7330/g.26663 Transcript_7330/m.26663 type:complete len:217 (+) Transcript_7330:56-706(+)
MMHLFDHARMPTRNIDSRLEGAIGIQEVVLDQAACDERCQRRKAERPRPSHGIGQAHRGRAWEHQGCVLVVPPGLNHALLQTPQALQHAHSCQSAGRRPRHAYQCVHVEDAAPCSEGSPPHRDQCSCPSVADVVLGLQARCVPRRPGRQLHRARALLANEPGAAPEQVGCLAAEEVRTDGEDGVRLRFDAGLLDIIEHIRQCGSKFAIAWGAQQLQ